METCAFETGFILTKGYTLPKKAFPLASTIKQSHVISAASPNFLCRIISIVHVPHQHLPKHVLHV